jgi:hypothetical protein
MTLFGGAEPMFDLVTPPDCMTGYIHEDLLWGYDAGVVDEASGSGESVFAWAMLMMNFEPVPAADYP